MFFFCISDPYTCLIIRNYKQNCLPSDFKFRIDDRNIVTLKSEVVDLVLVVSFLNRKRRWSYFALLDFGISTQ